ncbi:hypothetical protein EES39_32265 [Streptomyces sp. ADI92-24]|nr:hypothetical protein EES39_32265 [Streptomyces sp. ADI92-24]
MLLGTEPEQFGTQRRLLGELEAVPRRFRQPVRQVALAELRHPQPRLCRVDVEHPLARHAVDHRKDGAQALVPLDHVRQGGLQGGLVQGAGQPQSQRDVVSGTRALHTVQEPQSALREGQRDRLGPLAPPQSRARPARDVHRGRQLRHRRRVEQVAQPQLHAQHGPRSGNQPGGQQGVSAEVKEVVVDTGLGQAQHLGEQPGEQVLDSGARSSARCDGLPPGRREGVPVELAVRGQWQRVQHDERRRHHVLGQQLPQPVPQRVRPDVLSRGGDDVGDQQGFLVGAHRDGGPRDSPMFGENRLDLAEFDPEAADLDLVVGAAEELQVSVRVPPHQVTRAVHARAARTERVHHEPPRGQTRPVQIAARQARTCDVQLTRHTRGRRPQRGVEHVQPGVGDGSADDRARARCRGSGHRVDGALRGSIQVEAGESVGGPQPFPELLGDGLAARRDQRWAALRMVQQPMGDEHVEVGRGGLDVVQPAARRVVHEGFGGGPGRMIQDVQLVAGEEGHELVPGSVEGHRGGQRHAQPPPVLQQVCELHEPVVGEHVEQTAVRRHHTLGPAGGTRGVDHVRRVARIDGRHRVRDGAARHQGGCSGLVEHQPVDRARVGQTRTAAGVGHHQSRAGVVEQVRDPGGRVLGVDRDVRRSGLQHCEDRHHELGRPRQ